MQMSLKRRNFAVMIELGRHIEILLLSNDCVIVPELGGFMAHHVSAHYDEGDNLFLPPLRTLGFNPQLKLNDSLLAQSYIEAYDISYPEAIRRIEEEVNELKQHLDNQGSYEIDDIGVLSINEEGGYVFEPCEAGILTPELYGLSSFEIRNMSDVAVNAGNEADRHEEQPAIQQDLFVQNSVLNKDMEEEEDNSTIKIKVAWIRNAVAVTAAVIAFLFITTPVSNSESDHMATSSFYPSALLEPAEAKNQPSETKAEEIKNALVADEELQETSKESENAELEQEKAEAQTASDGYCIVMASHVAKQNAEAYVNELHGKGYTEAYVYTHNSIVRVVYGNYESEADAYSVLREIRGNKYFEQSWVYRKR